MRSQTRGRGCVVDTRRGLAVPPVYTRCGSLVIVVHILNTAARPSSYSLDLFGLLRLTRVCSSADCRTAMDRPWALAPPNYNVVTVQQRAYPSSLPCQVFYWTYVSVHTAITGPPRSPPPQFGTYIGVLNCCTRPWWDGSEAWPQPPDSLLIIVLQTRQCQSRPR